MIRRDSKGNALGDGRFDEVDMDGTVLVPPSERVRMILTEGEEGEESGDDIDLDGVIFCQLDVLCHFSSGGVGWKQMARWLKYEEKVEEGNRWSKPHVATTSLRSLFEIRQSWAQGDTITILDLEMKHSCEHRPADHITNQIAKHKNLSPEVAKQIYETLLRPHKHRHRKGKRTSTSEGMESVRHEALMYHSYPGGILPEDLSPHKPNKRFMKKIPEGTEAANIMIGHCEFLEEPIMVFVRLRHPSVLADMTEVSLPTRFIFLAIGPTRSSSMYEYEETGRALGTLFSDKVFCQVAYKAKKAEDLVDGLDEFIDGLTVLPPSIWDPATRLDPPQKALSKVKIERRLQAPVKAGPTSFHLADSSAGDPTLQRTGSLFGGLVADIKRRYPLYWSDIRDGFHIQCVASIVFLYFACITPIVTFGGLMGDGTDNYMGTMETIVAGAICGLVYAMFAGQPLTIIGATGPMLVFEILLFSFSEAREMDFLAFRFWVGMWITVILFVFVALDLSSLVRYITRFTEESFATLISLIFIYEAFKKVAQVWGSHPVGLAWDEGLDCYCRPILEGSPLPTTGTNGTAIDIFHYSNFSSMLHDDCINHNDDLVVNQQCLKPEICVEGGWRTNGTGCDVHTSVNAVPDVFFLCVFLFLATYTLACRLKFFRAAPYFPQFVRNNVSDFAVITAILFCIGVDALLGLDTPKLYVPGEFKTTREDRTWIVNPMTIPWYWMILAFIPAVLATILIFLDQQITAVIVNRKEHKFKKGHGYHLDLFVLSILLCVCSVMGLPWFVAATVRAVTHVRSLIRHSECSAPGDRPEMLGVREQRFTGIVIHILIGCSILFTGILKYVPMAVLYGVFLFMGITSLAGVQFIDRIALLFMPVKYQPDHIYLRHVRTSRVHIFTIIQIFCMLGMWVVKSIEIIAIGFPVMILLVCFVRKAMDFFFSENELYWLDHLLPEATRIKKEDTGEDDDSGDDEISDDPKAEPKTMTIEMGHIKVPARLS